MPWFVSILLFLSSSCAIIEAAALVPVTPPFNPLLPAPGLEPNQGQAKAGILFLSPGNLGTFQSTSIAATAPLASEASLSVSGFGDHLILLPLQKRPPACQIASFQCLICLNSLIARMHLLLRPTWAIVSGPRHNMRPPVRAGLLFSLSIAFSLIEFLLDRVAVVTSMTPVRKNIKSNLHAIRSIRRKPDVLKANWRAGPLF